MKKIDFRKIETRPTFEGKTMLQDISKTLGNKIRQNVDDIGLKDFASDIYYKGEVEVDKNKALVIKAVMDIAKYVIYIKEAVYPLLDEIVKEEEEEERKREEKQNNKSKK
ncbi:MAG: hypothetical protein LKI39_02720 [Bacteroides sp.]|jgi:hypothetical protein|nr:hypothetical protein [Bacteroides sp.]